MGTAKLKLHRKSKHQAILNCRIRPGRSTVIKAVLRTVLREVFVVDAAHSAAKRASLQL